MLVQSFAAVLLLAGQSASASATPASASASAAKHPRVLKNDFMRAMDARKDNKVRRMKRRKLGKEFQAEIHGRSKKGKELRQKIISKSKIVKAPGSPAAPKKEGGDLRRKLQNYNNNNYNYNGNGYSDATQEQAAADADAYYGNGEGNDDATAYVNYVNNNGNNGNKNYGYNDNGRYSATRDGADDYFMAYGEWENSFGFDPTQFSLSYKGCAAVRQYDTEIATQEDTASVFATKRFAVFRFCPENTCMGWEDDDEDFECDEDYYGEEYCAYMAEYAEYYRMQAQYNGNGDDEDGEDGGDGENGDNQEQNENAWYNNNYGSYEEEDEEMYGANGGGCQDNYGEYMMEMDEYLQLMMEWQEERYEQYCEYCEECMYRVYELWLENGGDRDDDNRRLSYEEFKVSKEHGQIRHLSQEHRKLGNYYDVCPEYDTCTEYQTVCQEGMDDEYSEYFECTQVQKNNGMIAYVGPHCAEDGMTITLGVFGDQYCNEYIGNGVNIANFIGEEVDYEEDMLRGYYNSAHGATLDQLKYINEDNVCIPCRAGNLMWQEGGNWNGDDDDNINWDGDDEINEVCESLYDVSARCDKHYRSYSNRSKQAKFAEMSAQEDLTCDFIDSVVSNTYNEMGFVDLGNNYNVEGQPEWMANNMYAQQYGHYVQEVTPLQIFGLIFASLAVVILGMWSVSLHRSFSKQGPWRPRRGFRSNAAPNAAHTDLNRQNSGIVMGRSASNTSYYMS